MDGSGRITKRNRLYLQPIILFNTQLQRKNAFQGQTDVIATNTGPTAVSREATTSLVPSQQHTEQHQQPAKDKSAASPVPAPDTVIRMSDEDFDKGLTQAVQSVQNIHQNKDKRPEAAEDDNTRKKRVKFPTKRFIQQY